jgi:hypothetical protein
LPNAREVFESLVRPLVRVIVERKLRQQVHRAGEPMPEAKFDSLVESGAKHLYDSLLASILLSPEVETVAGSWGDESRKPRTG